MSASRAQSPRIPFMRTGPRKAAEAPAPGATANIPLVTVRRLYSYARVLEELALSGETAISSTDLAALVGVKASQVRKDLAHFGVFGTRGKGYQVDTLLTHLTPALGLTREWPLVLVGLGNIGTALANYAGLGERGFKLTALFDVDPALVGTTHHGLPVMAVEDLTTYCREHQVALGIITVPAIAAQGIADALVAGGVTAILNVAPARLVVPESVAVRNVDISVELRLLSYLLLGEGSPAMSGGT